MGTCRGFVLDNGLWLPDPFFIEMPVTLRVIGATHRRRFLLKVGSTECLPADLLRDDQVSCPGCTM